MTCMDAYKPPGRTRQSRAPRAAQYKAEDLDRFGGLASLTAMLPDLYPERDPGILLAVSPARRPFPVVADTDELLREVAHRARTGNEPLMLGLARHSLARLFATDRVRQEVERDLPRFATERRQDPGEAMRAWHEEYLPLIRWVTLPDRVETGFRADEHGLSTRMQLVMERHSADAPTAELALLCAPCFVITGNSKHLHAAGFGDVKTRDALVAAGNAADLELNGIRALSLSELGARGTWALTARAARLAGDSPLMGALMLAAIIFLGFKAHEHREQLKAAAGRAANATMELLQEVAARHGDLIEILIPSLVSPLEHPTIENRVAQTLVRSPVPLSAEVIGYTRRPAVEREAALRGLRGHSAFVFWPGRGWTLGRHFAAPAHPRLLQRETGRE